VLERRGGGAFIAPQENLAVGLSETRTCPGQGLDMSGQPLWKPAWGLDKSSPRLSCYGNGLGRTYPGLKPDMSGKYLWNLAYKPDMLG
jgi:hypothetical protein